MTPQSLTTFTIFVMMPYTVLLEQKYSNFKKLFKTKVIIRIYIKYKPNSKKALAYQSKALMGEFSGKSWG